MRVQFDHFYTYAELTETLDAWAAAFPGLCRIEPIGQSYEGRDIPLVTVTNFETGASGTTSNEFRMPPCFESIRPSRSISIG